MPPIAIARAIGIRGFAAIGLAIALAFAWTSRNHWKDVAGELREQAATVVIALKQASGNEDVTWKTAPGQIVALGESNRALKVEIRENNQRIDEMAREALRLKAKARELKRIADKARAQKEMALRELSDMAIEPGTREDCLTLLAEAEAALDLVKEASQ